jgi:hypothetical protein
VFGRVPLCDDRELARPLSPSNKSARESFKF